jgi:O-antigen ligase
MIISAFVGSFIFTFFTLAGFSLHLFVLQDSYYHWFRDVASGKITEYGFNFYRINLNEHLLLIPLLLISLGNIINKKVQKIEAIIPLFLLGILSVNLTRIFILAMGVGLLFLFSKTNWKRWLLYSTTTVVGFFLIFTSVHLLASRGQSLGWEFFGLRLQSIAMPQTEDSSLSRLMLLPKILDKIKKYPVLGTGLGDAVTIFSPIFKENITTPHFDWGYLEIIAETGIIGMIIWLLLIGYCLFKATNWTLRASLLSLLVINLTSPALFHVLGVILIVFILSQNNLKSDPLPKLQA